MSLHGKVIAAVAVASAAAVLSTPADAGGLYGRDRDRDGRVAATAAVAGATVATGRRSCGLFGWLGERRRDGGVAVAGYTGRTADRTRWGWGDRMTRRGGDRMR